MRKKKIELTVIGWDMKRADGSVDRGEKAFESLKEACLFYESISGYGVKYITRREVRR